jgi:hypothetical protein
MSVLRNALEVATDALEPCGAVRVARTLFRSATALEAVAVSVKRRTRMDVKVATAACVAVTVLLTDRCRLAVEDAVAVRVELT